MATTTFHISLPSQLGKEIEKEMKEGYYSPSEYFKMLYRWHKQNLEEQDFADSVRVYRKEKKEGKLKKLNSLSDLMDKR